MRVRKMVSAFDLALIQKMVENESLENIKHDEDYGVMKKSISVMRLQDGKVKGVISYEYEEFDIPVKDEVVVVANHDFFNIVSFRRVS
ncbi:MAG: hypothetical protein C0177_07320 [Fervidicoccus fontis]|nr:MAG: hypothetical protein C0177_07320 [Fervidicoccus fontis]